MYKNNQNIKIMYKQIKKNHHAALRGSHKAFLKYS